MERNVIFMYRISACGFQWTNWNTGAEAVNQSNWNHVKKKGDEQKIWNLKL